MLEKDPSNWLNVIPFMLHTGQTQKLSLQRQSEAVIIAGITAGVVMYAGQKVLEAELSAIKREVADVKYGMQRMRDDLYVPANRQKTR